MCYMIKTFIKHDKLHTTLDNLHNWELNPREISDQGKERLKKQVQSLGQYKPLLVTKDGTVIGGNMRLKVYNELEKQDIWVSIIEIKEKEGKYKAFIDNEEQEKTFDSEKQVMLEYSLSDNDRAGFYVEDLTVSLSKELNIDLEMYSIDIANPKLISDLEKKIEENQDEMNFKPLYQVVIEAENEIEQKEIYEKINNLGYKCKTLTL